MITLFTLPSRLILSKESRKISTKATKFDQVFMLIPKDGLLGYNI